MLRRQGLLNSCKKFQCMIVLLWIVLLPISTSAQSQFLDVPGQQFSNIGQDLAEPPSPDEIIGEDVIVNVRQYRPDVIPTTVIEDEGMNIFVSLEGKPTNPSIEISSIDRVITQPIKITTIPPDMPVSLGAIRHVAPPRGELSYDNLGYIVVPIRRIPKEAEVPDQIDIEMASRIFFGVTTGLTFGPHDDVLTKQDYSSWLIDKEKHRFYAGYLRADEVGKDDATFTVYDKDGNEVTTLPPIREGSTSSVMNAYKPGFSTFGRVFDRFRIKVNEIRGRDDKVSAYITHEGVTTHRVLSKGQHLFAGSTWYVDDIIMNQNRAELVLKNSKGQTTTLSASSYKKEAEEKKALDNRPCPLKASFYDIDDRSKAIDYIQRQEFLTPNSVYMVLEENGDTSKCQNPHQIYMVAKSGSQPLQTAILLENAENIGEEYQKGFTLFNVFTLDEFAKNEDVEDIDSIELRVKREGAYDFAVGELKILPEKKKTCNLKASVYKNVDDVGHQEKEITEISKQELTELNTLHVMIEADGSVANCNPANNRFYIADSKGTKLVLPPEQEEIEEDYSKTLEVQEISKKIPVREGMWLIRNSGQMLGETAYDDMIGNLFIYDSPDALKERSTIHELSADELKSIEETEDSESAEDDAGEGTEIKKIRSEIEKIEESSGKFCRATQIEISSKECYSTVISPLHEMANSGQLSDPLKAHALEILLFVSTEYFVYLSSLEERVDKATEELKSSKSEKVKAAAEQELKEIAAKKQILSEHMRVRDASVAMLNIRGEGKTSVVQTTTEAYRQARQSYQQIVEEFPKSEYTLRALYRIGRIQWLHEKSPLEALQTFERMVNEYGEAEIDKLKGVEGISYNDLLSIINLLKRQKEGLTMAGAVKEFSEPDGSVTAVAVIDIEKVSFDQGASTKIEVGGVGATYRINDVLTVGNIAWRVSTIKENTVQLTYVNAKSDTMSFPLSVGKNEPQYPDSDQDKKLSAQNKVPVRVISTNLQREVYITIEPAVEQAFSEARYTLHLPIQKRPFGLPLFSETIDDEIYKTEQLIAKLDKIIAQAAAIHEVWIKSCYITYAVLWIKNLFWNYGRPAVSRNKVNEIYREKYETNQLDCGGLTFEQCIREKHLTEYENDLEFMGDVLDDAEDANYQERFKNLGSNYEDDKKTLYIYERLRQKYPDDPMMRDKYFAYLQNMQLRDSETGITTRFYSGAKPKVFDELKPEDQEAVQGAIDSTPELKKIFEQSSGEPHDKYKDVYDKYQTIVLGNYRETQVSQEMDGFYKTLTSGNHEFAKVYDKDKESVQRLKDGFFRQPGTNAEIAKHKIREENGTFYFFNGYTKTPINISQEDFKKDAFSTSVSDAVYTFTSTTKKEPHRRIISLMQSGPAKGKAEFMTIDANHYLQLRYSDSGRMDKVLVFKRPQPNGPLGSEFDVGLGEYKDVLPQLQRQPEFEDVYRDLMKTESCISSANKKLSSSSYTRGETNIIDCAGLGSYSIGTALKSTQSSCIDYMSPGDCRIMYNACDPVICPASRCDFGGEWQVENVVQTGIIGSTVLCARNFPEVVMPICITGIIAGLQNIKSIIAGYRECLISSKIEGESVGICDQIRSIGICEILWREVVAMANLKKGILGAVRQSIFGGSSGGGEYAEFDKSFENSVGNLKYFTQDYAKNIFAQYNGGSLPEIGAAICKSAIYGEMPGIGNFLDQITQPESPPQFTAFFEEVPVTDITNTPVSQYNIFYRIYAGQSQDVTFRLYLRARDLNDQQIMPPLILIPYGQVPKGQFLSPESISIQRPSGYDEICIELTTPNYGKQEVCGFGKISTNFLLNFANGKFIKGEIEKKSIDSEEECVPEQGAAVYPNYGAGGLAISTFVPGALSTGIVRKCSLYDPDVGTSKEDWVPVGTCGKDDRKRDLGTCWLYGPGALELVKNAKDLAELKGTLEEQAREIIKNADIPKVTVISREEVQALLTEAAELRSQATVAEEQGAKAKYMEAIAKYDKILSAVLVDEAEVIVALYEKGKTYEAWASLLLRKEIISDATLAEMAQSPCPVKASFYKEFSDININKAVNSIQKQELVYAEFFYAVLEATGEKYPDLCSQNNNQIYIAAVGIDGQIIQAIPLDTSESFNPDEKYRKAFTIINTFPENQNFDLIDHIDLRAKREGLYDFSAGELKVEQDDGSVPGSVNKVCNLKASVYQYIDELGKKAEITIDSLQNINNVYVTIEADGSVEWCTDYINRFYFLDKEGNKLVIGQEDGEITDDYSRTFNVNNVIESMPVEIGAWEIRVSGKRGAEIGYDKAIGRLDIGGVKEMVCELKASVYQYVSDVGKKEKIISTISPESLRNLNNLYITVEEDGDINKCTDYVNRFYFVDDEDNKLVIGQEDGEIEDDYLRTFNVNNIVNGIPIEDGTWEIRVSGIQGTTIGYDKVIGKLDIEDQQ